MCSIDHNPLLDKSLIHVVKGEATAVYVVLLDGHGEAKMGVGDMAIHQTISPEIIDQVLDNLTASFIVIDG